MSDHLIRLYKDSDYDVARQLFVYGTNEHTGAAFRYGIRRTHFWLTLLAILTLPSLGIVSLTTSLLAIAMCILFVWLVCWDYFGSYVRVHLRTDMMDIQKNYMKQDGCCFWVAESGGQVVGTVAAGPSPYPGGENHLELKRLSVFKSHRGRGIAKALCKTMIDFARRGGYEAVILVTNIVQIDACTLYDKVGFRLSHTFYLPHRFVKLFGLKNLFYQYDISK